MNLGFDDHLDAMVADWLWVLVGLLWDLDAYVLLELILLPFLLAPCPLALPLPNLHGYHGMRASKKKERKKHTREMNLPKLVPNVLYVGQGLLFIMGIGILMEIGLWLHRKSMLFL